VLGAENDLPFFSKYLLFPIPLREELPYGFAIFTDAYIPPVTQMLQLPQMEEFYPKLENYFRRSSLLINKEKG